MALGMCLVSVAACEGLPCLWPAALGQAALCSHSGGDTASLQAAQKSFLRNVQRAAGPSSMPMAFVTMPCIPCPIPAGWHAAPRTQGLFLLPTTARRKGRQEITLWGQVESSL